SLGLIWGARDQLLVLDGFAGKAVLARLTIAADGHLQARADRIIGDFTRREPIASNGRDLAFIQARDTLGVGAADYDDAHLGALQLVQKAAWHWGWLPAGRLVISRKDGLGRTTELALVVRGAAPVSMFPEEPGAIDGPAAIDGDRVLYVRRTE